MIRGKTISLITPCRNEAAIIGGFVNSVPRYVDEVVVVDNQSTDDSAVVAKKAGAKVVIEPRVTDGIGYGFAHMNGIKTAKGDYLVAMDADDTYPVEEIRCIVSFMEKTGLDFVSCNRLPLKTPGAISWVRQLGIHILNATVFLLYGYPIRDILTGMWVMKRDVAQKLTLAAGDWDFSPEIKLAALAHPEVRFGEYHIDHFVRAKEPSKQQIFETGWKHLCFIVHRRLAVDTPLAALFSPGKRAIPAWK